MQRLVYRVFYHFLQLVSLLPFPLLYSFSDLSFFLVYYIAGYRKKTVTSNLTLVFPEKSSAEIKKIRKNFYRHLCDMFLEMIKSISISENELKSRFTFTNLEEIRHLRKTDKSILLLCGHYASYEWLNALQFYDTGYKGVGVYKYIRNPNLDELLINIRGRFDAAIVSGRKLTPYMIAQEKKGIKAVYAMIADQAPKIEIAKYWANFLGQRVPVYLGPERLAKKFDLPVLYLQVEKIKRGYYRATFVPITVNPTRQSNFRITGKYLSLLEKQIRQQPEYYLWTHKRWKHRNVPLPANATVINRD